MMSLKVLSNIRYITIEVKITRSYILIVYKQAYLSTKMTNIECPVKTKVGLWIAIAFEIGFWVLLKI
jgi:hypothetical protein